MQFYKLLLLIVIPVFYLVSCDEDEPPIDLCNTNIAGADYYLDSESESYLTNYMNNDSIFFINQDSDTVLFEVAKRSLTLVPYGEIVPCPTDSSKSILREGLYEEQYVTLFSQDLNLHLYYRLFNPSLTEFLSSDILWLAKGNTANFQLPDVVNNNNFLSQFSTHHPLETPDNPFVVNTESLNLNGKLFFNVMEPNPDNTGLTGNVLPDPYIRFTKFDGIISIDDSASGQELIYCGSR